MENRKRYLKLPIQELISNPQTTTTEALQQQKATPWDDYQRIAFDDKNANEQSKGNARIVEFMTNRPIQKNRTNMMKKKVQTPLISLTPIPTLHIDRVNVDFQMEVTSSETDKSNISSDVSTKISRGCFEKAEINGKVGTFHENTYLSNQTAKYQIHASASQHPQTKDSSIPMNIMGNCMDQKPKKYSSSKEDEEKNGERTE